jgi:hypothetical protein
MPRSRALFTAPIVLAIIIIGVFAIRSRGDNSANVDTTPTKNCPPIARADAVATKPATPLSIDVLANDTDPDGDPLVFQIRNTTGGDSTIDDGGTPTDASDDRVMFTPADPAPPEATIDYQALDPDGALSESTVTVTINADGVLPAGVASEPVPTNGKSPSSNGCGTGRASTSTTGGTATTDRKTTGSTAPEISGDFTTPNAKNPSSKNTNGHTTTTHHTTTTRVKDNGPGTTQPHPPTTEPTATTQPSPPPTTGTTQPDNCGPYPTNGTQEQKDAWRQCHIDQGH